MCDIIRNVRVGSVWYMEIPYDDSTEAKKRPVVVLGKATSKYGNTYTVVPLYSNFDECEYNSTTVCNGTDNDHTSFARVTKMRPAIDADLFHYVGDLSEEKFCQIKKKLADFLSASVPSVEEPTDAVVSSEPKSDTVQTDVSDDDAAVSVTCKRNVPPMWDRYVAMYRDGRITAAQISKELGIKYNTIYYRLRREVEKK